MTISTDKVVSSQSMPSNGTHLIVCSIFVEDIIVRIPRGCMHCATTCAVVQVIPVRTAGADVHPMHIDCRH